jgi:hypothetical protein
MEQELKEAKYARALAEKEKEDSLLTARKICDDLRRKAEAWMASEKKKFEQALKEEKARDKENTKPI